MEDGQIALLLPSRSSVLKQTMLPVLIFEWLAISYGQMNLNHFPCSIKCKRQSLDSFLVHAAIAWGYGELFEALESSTELDVESQGKDLLLQQLQLRAKRLAEALKANEEFKGTEKITCAERSSMMSKTMATEQMEDELAASSSHHHAQIPAAKRGSVIDLIQSGQR
jgi:hypothetical protein